MKLRTKALWILMGDGGAKLFGLLATLLLARTFGVESYGEITYALSILGIAGLFTDMGLHTLGTRNSALQIQFSGSPEAQNGPSSLFWLRILLAISVFAIFFPIICVKFAGQPQLRMLTLLFLISVVPQALQTEWHFRGTQRFRWYSLSRWIQSLTYLIGLLLLAQTRSVTIVPVIFSVSILFAVLFQWAGYKPLHELFRRPRITAWKKLIRSGIYLTAGSFLFQTVILLPPILMELRFSLYELGLFGAMFKIILAAMIADRVFTTLLLPNLAVLHQQPNANIAGEIRPIVVWMLFFGLMGSIFLTFLASGLTGLLFGEQYLTGAAGLPILSLFLPVTFVNSVYLFGLISAGRDQSYLQAGVRGGLVAVVFMAAGALSGSYTVFLLSLPLAEAAITYVVYRSYRQTIPATFPIRAWRLVLVYLPIAGLGITVLDLNDAGLTANNLVVALLALLLFIAGARATGGISKEDLQWLKRRVQ